MNVMNFEIERGPFFLSPERIVNMLVPLANVQRITVLQCLLRGEKRFGALLRTLKITHSPLRFHLKILIENGYVVQEGERGSYSITPKGKTILLFLESLAQPPSTGTQDLLPTDIPHPSEEKPPTPIC